MSEATPENSPRGLRLRRILLGAFSLPWANRVAVVRSVGLPFLVFVVLDLTWSVPGVGESAEMRWLAWGTYVIAAAWFATTLHRLVLANGWEARPGFTDLQLRRIVIFAGALVVLWALYYTIVMIVTLMLGLAINAPDIIRYVPAGETPPSRRLDPEWVRVVARVLACWCVARYSLVLPAIATDRKPDLGDIVRKSSGNATKLAIIIGALPAALELITNGLWRDGATSVEVALLSVLSSVLAIFGIVALSLSYYELTHASAPPPTHPPA
jgi:hypothetical protein